MEIGLAFHTAPVADAALYRQIEPVASPHSLFPKRSITRNRRLEVEGEEADFLTLSRVSPPAGDDPFTREHKTRSLGGDADDEDGFALLPARDEGRSMNMSESAMPIYPPLFLPPFLPLSLPFVHPLRSFGFVHRSAPELISSWIHHLSHFTDGTDIFLRPRIIPM